MKTQNRHRMLSAVSVYKTDPHLPHCHTLETYTMTYGFPLRNFNTPPQPPMHLYFRRRAIYETFIE